MDPLWPLTASPFLNLHHNPHPLQKGFLFHFWVTVFGWCTPKTVATEQQRRKTAHIKPTEFQTALNSVCWGRGGRLRAGNHSQPRPHGSEPPLHLQYYFANSKEPFWRTAPSRWAGEKEWRWKWKRNQCYNWRKVAAAQIKYFQFASVWIVTWMVMFLYLPIVQRLRMKGVIQEERGSSEVQQQPSTLQLGAPFL